MTKTTDDYFKQLKPLLSGIIKVRDELKDDNEKNELLFRIKTDVELNKDEKELFKQIFEQSTKTTTRLTPTHSSKTIGGKKRSRKSKPRTKRRRRN